LHAKTYFKEVAFGEINKSKGCIIAGSVRDVILDWVKKSETRGEKNVHSEGNYLQSLC